MTYYRIQHVNIVKIIKYHKLFILTVHNQEVGESVQPRPVHSRVSRLYWQSQLWPASKHHRPDRSTHRLHSMAMSETFLPFRLRDFLK